MFDQKWPLYCADTYETPFAVPAFLAFSLALYIGAYAWQKKENPSSRLSQLIILSLSAASLILTEYLIYSYTWLGLNYIFPTLLNEHHLDEGSISSFLPNLSLDGQLALLLGFIFPRYIPAPLSMFLSRTKKKANLIKAITFSLISDLYLLVYAASKGLAMVTLTMEFYASQFGYTDNATQVLIGSSLMGFISAINVLRELNFLKVLELSQCNLNKWKPRDREFIEKLTKSFGNPHDYLCHVYPHIHLLLTSLPTPIVFGAFLSTFSSMTVTAGSDPTMQTLSYIAFVTLGYCANILADKSKSFKLVHETVMTFLESWAFMYATYLNILTHQQSIDNIVFYHYFSNYPLLFAGFMAPVSVLYMFYQLSASHFIPMIQKKIKKEAPKINNEETQENDTSNKQNELAKSLMESEPKKSSKPGYLRHSVARDGMCGYRSFGIEPKKALSLLLEQIELIKEHLNPLVQEALRTNASFFQYLLDNDAINPEIANETVIQNPESYLSPAVYRWYLTYDILKKGFNGGYAHPVVLRALAQTQEVALTIWHLDEKDALQAHKSPFFDYFEYTPEKIKDPRQVDILFVDGNHFELIEPSNEDHPLSVGDMPISSSPEKTDEKKAPEPAQQLVLSQEQTTYFTSKVPQSSGSTYHLMIKQTDRRSRRIQRISDIDQEVFFDILFKTIIGGYYIDKLLAYCSKKPEKTEPDSPENVSLSVITWQPEDKENALVDIRIDSDPEETDEHNEPEIHAPTLTAILATLILGSAPFGINLRDAIIAEMDALLTYPHRRRLGVYQNVPIISILTTYFKLMFRTLALVGLLWYATFPLHLSPSNNLFWTKNPASPKGN